MDNNIITVDFDGTLVYQLKNRKDLKPKIEIVEYVKSKIRENLKIIILTCRMEEDKEIIKNFCEENSITIEKIICTNRESKLPFVKLVNPLYHIDNNFKTCLELKSHGYNVYFVTNSIKNKNLLFKKNKLSLD